MRPGLAVRVALAAQLARRESRCHRTVAKRHDRLSGQQRVDAGVAVPGHHDRCARQGIDQRPGVLLCPWHAPDHAGAANLQRMRPKPHRQPVLRSRGLRRLRVPRTQVTTLQRGVAVHLADQKHVLTGRLPWLQRNAQATEPRPEVVGVVRERRQTVESVPADAGLLEPVTEIAALEHQHIAPAPAVHSTRAPSPAHNHARVLLQHAMSAQAFHDRLPVCHLVRRPLTQVEVHGQPASTQPMPIAESSATNSATLC